MSTATTITPEPQTEQPQQNTVAQDIEAGKFTQAVRDHLNDFDRNSAAPDQFQAEQDIEQGNFSADVRNKLNRDELRERVARGEVTQEAADKFHSEEQAAADKLARTSEVDKALAKYGKKDADRVWSELSRIIPPDQLASLKADPKKLREVVDSVASQLGATKAEPREHTAGRQNQEQGQQDKSADDRLLRTLSTRGDEAFEDAVNVLSDVNTGGHPAAAEHKELLVEAAEKYSGAELKSVLKTLQSDIFPSSQEGFARTTVFRHALNQCSNARQTLLYLADPANSSILRNMQNASPQDIARAIHQVSADLKFGGLKPKAAAQEARSARQFKAPAEVSARGSAPSEDEEYKEAVEKGNFTKFKAIERRRMEREFARR